jgi:hypothetical protein
MRQRPGKFMPEQELARFLKLVLDIRRCHAARGKTVRGIHPASVCGKRQAKSRRVALH